MLSCPTAGFMVWFPKFLGRTLESSLCLGQLAFTVQVSKNISVLREFEKNLDILNPLSILERGYSIIQNKSGSSIKSISEVESGDILIARLNKGFLDIEVKNKKDA